MTGRAVTTYTGGLRRRKATLATEITVVMSVAINMAAESPELTNRPKATPAPAICSMPNQNRSGDDVCPLMTGPAKCLLSMLQNYNWNVNSALKRVKEEAAHCADPAPGIFVSSSA